MASCQIPNIVGCACAGNAWNVFPSHRVKRKPLVSDPGMHHGTCVNACAVMHGGIANPRWPGKRFPTTRNFTYLARGPWPLADVAIILTVCIVRIEFPCTFCEIALRCMPQNSTDDMSTMVQIMAWCRQATNHYPSQC